MREEDLMEEYMEDFLLLLLIFGIPVLWKSLPFFISLNAAEKVARAVVDDNERKHQERIKAQNRNSAALEKLANKPTTANYIDARQIRVYNEKTGKYTLYTRADDYDY